MNSDFGDPAGAVQFDGKRRVFHLVAREFPAEFGQFDARRAGRPIGFLRKFARTLVDRFAELRGRDQFVDQPPLDRSFSFDTLLNGAEYVREVPTNFSLVHHAGESAGTRQHREQRNFRQ